MSKVIIAVFILLIFVLVALNAAGADRGAKAACIIGIVICVVASFVLRIAYAMFPQLAEKLGDD